jgi:hypothetical protein
VGTNQERKFDHLTIFFRLDMAFYSTALLSGGAETETGLKAVSANAE